MNQLRIQFITILTNYAAQSLSTAERMCIKLIIIYMLFLFCNRKNFKFNNY